MFHSFMNTMSTHESPPFLLLIKVHFIIYQCSTCYLLKFEVMITRHMHLPFKATISTTYAYSSLSLSLTLSPKLCTPSPSYPPLTFIFYPVMQTLCSACHLWADYGIWGRLYRRGMRHYTLYRSERALFSSLLLFIAIATLTYSFYGRLHTVSCRCSLCLILLCICASCWRLLSWLMRVPRLILLWLQIYELI